MLWSVLTQAELAVPVLYVLAAQSAVRQRAADVSFRAGRFQTRAERVRGSARVLVHAELAEPLLNVPGPQSRSRSLERTGEAGVSEGCIAWSA